MHFMGRRAMPRLIKREQLRAKTGQSDSTTDRLIEAGLFPKPVKITAGRIGWVEEEVDQWIAERIRVRDEGAESTDPVIIATMGKGRPRRRSQAALLTEGEQPAVLAG